MVQSNSDNVGTALIFSLLLLVTCVPYAFGSMVSYYYIGGLVGGILARVMEAIGLGENVGQLLVAWGSGFLILVVLYRKADLAVLKTILFMLVVPVSFVFDLAFSEYVIDVRDGTAWGIYTTIGVVKSILLSGVYYSHPIVNMDQQDVP